MEFFFRDTLVGVLLTTIVYVIEWIFIYFFFYIEGTSPFVSQVYLHGIKYIGFVQFIYLIPLFFYSAKGFRWGYLLSAAPFLIFTIFSMNSDIDKRKNLVMLDREQKMGVGFRDLPKKVQDIMAQSTMENRTKLNRFDWFFSVNDEIVETKESSLSDGIPTFIEQGLNWHIYLKGIHFVISSKVTYLIVFDGRNIYFPDELNFTNKHVEVVGYYVIDLSKYWKN